MGLDQKSSNGGSSSRINISEEFNKTNIWRQVNEKKHDEKHSSKQPNKSNVKSSTINEKRREDSYQQHIIKNTQP